MNSMFGVKMSTTLLNKDKIENLLTVQCVVEIHSMIVSLHSV